MKRVKTALKKRKPLKKKRKSTLRSVSAPKSSVLRFTPYAWAKLLFLRDLGESEVGGFGISAPDDLLLIEDIKLVKQQCTVVTVKFDDASVADLFDEQVDQGRKPEEFSRIWIHTHPGSSAEPSHVDEATFAQSFGVSDWALMFILSKNGTTYARLRFHVGPGGQSELPVEIDYGTSFPAANQAAWEQEFQDMVTVACGGPGFGIPRGSDFQLYDLGDYFEDAFFPELEGDLFCESLNSGECINNDFDHDEEDEL